MDNNTVCQNWEQLYNEVHNQNKKLETENSNLSDRLRMSERRVSEMQNDRDALHEEWIKLKDKEEAFEFVFSRVKNITI